MSRWRTSVAFLLSAVVACAAATVYFTSRGGEGATLSPRPAADALRGDPERRAREPASDRKAGGEAMVIAPLFDPKARFRPGETVALRFRALDEGSGSPISSAAISVSISRASGHEESRQSAREIGGGIYEVPFTPSDEGQFRLVVTSDDGTAIGLAPTSLGVGGAPRGVGPAGAEQAGPSAEVIDEDERRLRRVLLARRRGRR